MGLILALDQRLLQAGVDRKDCHDDQRPAEDARANRFVGVAVVEPKNRLEPSEMRSNLMGVRGSLAV